ncbi:P2Y purinoceptor 14-like, partial [Simochromis diagramma]|uniref:P2Y purinoceptor 14-like n=1 Tax=Simochromis diagramma TaxID=43689 RepID=UPI001A7ED5B3
MFESPVLFILSVSLQVGLLLNGFILKFYFHQVRQQASNSLMVYLKHLTAADFLLCLSLPLRIIHYASSSGIVYILHCSIGATSLYLNMYASILFMGYIAVNRYLKIVHPSGTHILQTVRTAHVVSTVTWVFLLAQTIAYNIMFFITHNPLASDRCYCGPLFSTSFSVLHKTFQISCTIIFLLVFICLVFFYYSTSRKVLQAQQRQLASSEKLVKSRRKHVGAGEKDVQESQRSNKEKGREHQEQQGKPSLLESMRKPLLSLLPLHHTTTLAEDYKFVTE